MIFRRYPGKRIGIFRTLLILCCAGGVLFLCDRQLEPYLDDIVQTRAKNYAQQVINDAVEDLLTEEEWGYGDFVTLQKGETQQITALSVDSYAVNRFQTEVAKYITHRLSNGKRVKEKIALGTLLGDDWTRERGISLPFYYALQGEAECQLQNDFDAAGINQTRHSILLEVTCNISARIPGLAEEKFSQTGRFLIAETVIVGQVPESYWGTALESANLFPLE